MVHVELHAPLEPLELGQELLEYPCFQHSHQSPLRPLAATVRRKARFAAGDVLDGSTRCRWLRIISLAEGCMGRSKRAMCSKSPMIIWGLDGMDSGRENATRPERTSKDGSIRNRVLSLKMFSVSLARYEKGFHSEL